MGADAALVHCWLRGTQLAHSCLRWMQAQLQPVEAEVAINGDEQLTVESKLGLGQLGDGRTMSGKKRLSDLPDLALSSTIRPLRKTRQRKPSHLGSNCQPSSRGSASTRRASMGFRSVGTLRRIRRRAGAWEGITLGSCPRHPQTLLQTGECQGRTDHGEMQRAEEREPSQDNKHGGVPRPLCTS